MDILADGEWERVFTEKPDLYLQRKKSRHGLHRLTALHSVQMRSSHLATTLNALTKSGVKYVAQPGGSIRDQDVIDACNKHGMAMAFTGLRLFHH